MSVNLNKPECYVASPYGFTESTREWYNEKLLPMLGKYVTILDPWVVDVEHILSASAEEKPRLWVELGKYHYATIKDKAKLMVAGLDQEPPDIGTCNEVTWAAAHGIPVIGYRGDLRSSGEDGMKYNLMLPAAIQLSGGVEVSTLEALESTVEWYAARIN